MSDVERTPYERLGGSPFFARLVDTFYARVESESVLRPLYPGSDLEPAAERLRLFLEQYWGGPTTYSDQRGHPRLRIRHAHFAIDQPPTGAGSRTCGPRWTSSHSQLSSMLSYGATSSQPQARWSTRHPATMATRARPRRRLKPH
jgi:hypothetical protein